jgi:porphobilinogen synthase
MPGVDRLSLDLLLPVAEECVKLEIPVLALFPAIDASAQDARRQGSPEPRRPDPARGARAEEGIPRLGVMTDVALDPYTSHGQDGILDETGYILNDDTVEVLAGQAHAEAGVDMVAPAT